MTSPLSPGLPALRHVSMQDMLPKTSGGLLWDVINNFVGLAGRPLLTFICVNVLYAVDSTNQVRFSLL